MKGEGLWRRCAPVFLIVLTGSAMKSLAASVVTVVLLAGSLAAARTWTNDEGETIEADLLRVKGRTAILSSSGSQEIQAPIARLSPADQEWIERYKELTDTREWGVPGEGTRRGQFLTVVQGNIRLKQGSSTTDVPFEELSPEGWMLVYEAYELYEKPPSQQFLDAKPLALSPRDNGVDPLTAPVREWTDVKGRSLRAAYLGTDGPNALLFLRAKEVPVPLLKLSESDRRWVAEQKLARFNAGLQSATVAFAQMAQKAARNPSLRQQLAPPPPPTPPVPDPAALAAAEPAATPEPTPEPAAAPPGPTLSHINRMSDSEQRQRLEEAFGDLAVLEENFVGAATCDHCKGYFIFPDGYGIGDPCPYCTAKVQQVASLKGYQSGGGTGAPAKGTGSAPWYSSGLARGLIAVAVVAVLGVVTKLAMSGGSDDDDEDEDDE